MNCTDAINKALTEAFTERNHQRVVVTPLEWSKLPQQERASGKFFLPQNVPLSVDDVRAIVREELVRAGVVVDRSSDV